MKRWAGAAFVKARLKRTAAISSILLLSLAALFLLNYASAQSQQSLSCVYTGSSPLDNSTSQLFIRSGYPTYVNMSNSLFVSGGDVGIGTASPRQKLTVAGTIESTSGGIKFPDGSVQTTAATTTEPYLKDYAKTATITQSGWDTAPSPASEVVDSDRDDFATAGSVSKSYGGSTPCSAGWKYAYQTFDLGGRKFVQKISVHLHSSQSSGSSSYCEHAAAPTTVAVQISSNNGASYSDLWRWNTGTCGSKNLDQLFTDENFRDITHLRLEFGAGLTCTAPGSGISSAGASVAYYGRKVSIVGE